MSHKSKKGKRMAKTATPPELAVDIERERSDRASTLARQTTERAVELAEKRARELALMEARLTGHDTALADMKVLVERIANGLEGLKEALTDVVVEKRSVVNLQNRQIAVIAAIGMIVYFIITKA